MEKKPKATTRARAAAPTTKKKSATTSPAARKATAPRTRAAKPAAAAPVATPAPFQPSHEQIAAFAYSLFEQSGHQHGRALEHWLEAESRLGQGLKL